MYGAYHRKSCALDPHTARLDWDCPVSAVEAKEARLEFAIHTHHTLRHFLASDNAVQVGERIARLPQAVTGPAWVGEAVVEVPVPVLSESLGPTCLQKLISPVCLIT